MESTAQPLVMFVILNWKNADDTLACLASLGKTTYDRFEAVVIENGSHDDSLVRISAWKSSYPLHILPQKENLGFAGGVSVGIRHAIAHNADFIFLLNNDARIAPDTLKTMIAVALKHQNIGIFGPIIYHLADNVRTDWVWFAGGSLDWLDIARVGKHETTLAQHPKDIQLTSFITGCAMLIRREGVKAIREFDDRFFLYFEDIDYSLRAQKAGWGIAVVLEAKLWHKVSATTLTQTGVPAILYYHHRNGLLLAQKHAPIFIKFYMHCWAGLKLAKQALKIFRKIDEPAARAILAGIYDYYRKNFEKVKRNF